MHPATLAALCDFTPAAGGVVPLLELSLHHLPPHLADQNSPRHLNTIDGVSAYPLPFGWLMYVPRNPDEHAADYDGDDDPTDEASRKAVLVVQRHAAARGCGWVLFDEEVRPIPDLPTTWEQE